jgi:hypothetical protein
MFIQRRDSNVGKPALGLSKKKWQFSQMSGDVKMNDSIGKLMAFADKKDACSTPPSELEPLWIEAINARFQECRSKIRVLDQLAGRGGIKEVKSLNDVVPLLFAHSSYKSYPESFIDNGRWDRLTLWLDTLSKHKTPNINFEGIRDADDWMERLHGVGHHVFATSGTSGKNSFLNQSQADVDFSNYVTLPKDIPTNNSRPIIVLGPRKAPNRASQTFANMVAKIGRPGAVHYLMDAEMRISDLSSMMRMRRKIADGTAKPSEIAEFESGMRLRRDAAGQMLDTLIDTILSYRNEPCVIVGLTPQLWQIVEAAKARGLEPGCFHKDTYVMTGGGTKGFDLPADHLQQIAAFMGITLDTFKQGYGMQETSMGAGMNEWGRYEFPAWMVPLLLNDEGDSLLPVPASGRVSGRLALFDVSIDGRWGGIISGDRVTIDYDRGPAGRPVPAVVDIARYSELEGGSDKLTCAGTVDSFVRGALEE